MSKEIEIAPTNLSECFKTLDDILSEAEDGDWFKSADEEEAISQSHHGLGQWIRNNWELWKGENKLCEYFSNLGLKHADDISEVILTSYHRHLNKKDLELNEQIKEYVEFWKNNSHERSNN